MGNNIINWKIMLESYIYNDSSNTMREMFKKLYITCRAKDISPWRINMYLAVVTDKTIRAIRNELAAKCYTPNFRKIENVEAEVIAFEGFYIVPFAKNLYETDKASPFHKVMILGRTSSWGGDLNSYGEFDF